MKKFLLLLSILLLAFSGSAQAYIGTGLVGAPMNMLLMPGVNPCLLVAPNPAFMLAPVCGVSPIATPHIFTTLSVMPTPHMVLPLGPCVQPGSSVTIIGIQSSTTPSVQDMVLSVITNLND